MPRYGQLLPQIFIFACPLKVKHAKVCLKESKYFVLMYAYQRSYVVTVGCHLSMTQDDEEDIRVTNAAAREPVSKLVPYRL